MDMAIEAFGDNPVSASTSAKLCFRQEYVTNASGWQFWHGEFNYIYADDKKGIPLSMPFITINEVNVDSPQEPLFID